METISKCRVCGSERLLHGTMHDSSLAIPNPVFRLIHSDIPFVLLPNNDATACLDCGTIFTRADPLNLQKTAARWMSDTPKTTGTFLGYQLALWSVGVAITFAILLLGGILCSFFI